MINLGEVKRARKLIDAASDILAKIEDEKSDADNTPKKDLPRLAIIVGHENDSPGAYLNSKACADTGLPASLRSERFFNGLVATAAQSYAARKGITCQVFYRDGDLSWRRNLAKCYDDVEAFLSQGARNGLAVELHFDAYNTNVQGTSVLVSKTGNTGNLYELEYQIADAYLQNLYRLFGRVERRQKRGIKSLVSDDRGHYNLMQLSKNPSILLEPVFGDNYDDAKMFIEKRLEYALLIVDTFIQVNS